MYKSNKFNFVLYFLLFRKMFLLFHRNFMDRLRISLHSHHPTTCIIGIFSSIKHFLTKFISIEM